MPPNPPPEPMTPIQAQRDAERIERHRQDSPARSRALDERRAELIRRRDQRAVAKRGVRVQGLALAAPDGSMWRVDVDNDGKLTTTQIASPAILDPLPD